MKGCDVSDTNPVLPADDLAITPTNTFLEFGETVSVHCKENGNKITDGFVKLELVSACTMHYAYFLAKYKMKSLSLSLMFLS